MKEQYMKIVVTGCAGFIGYHLSKRLLELGHEILGIDNLNDYYDPNLKQARLKLLLESPHFTFVKLDICDYAQLSVTIGQDYKIIIHLAAQAGVRYSIDNPFTYVQNNVVGHLNILEICRNIKDFKKLIYASSSSVYGSTKKTQAFSVHDRVDEPVSLYAATKKADELMSYTYSHLYNLDITGLRFFTVVGPWGRPDMAPFLFTKKIFADEPINVFNYGDLRRDFTYIDDIVQGIISCIELESNNTHKIYNLGNNRPVKLLDFIAILEKIIGKEAEKEYATNAERRRI